MTDYKNHEWINANGSYVYLGKGMNNSASADHVVMYEKKQDHEQEGMNFLYADGHVEWKTMPQAEAEIARADAAKKQ